MKKEFWKNHGLRYYKCPITEHCASKKTKYKDTHSVLSIEIILRLSDLLFEHVDLNIDVVEVMVVWSMRGGGRGVGGEPLLQRGRRRHRRRQT